MYMQKKARLHVFLLVAAALGSTASVLSGTLAALEYSAAAEAKAETRHA
jgi:hypothetical protein